MGSSEILRRFELVVDFEELATVPRFLRSSHVHFTAPLLGIFSTITPRIRPRQWS